MKRFTVTVGITVGANDEDEAKRVVSSRLHHFLQYVCVVSVEEQLALPRPWRFHRCREGHEWRAPVTFGSTLLSGERQAICPTCGATYTYSEPWTLEDGSSYPFDLLMPTIGIPSEWRDKT